MASHPLSARSVLLVVVLGAGAAGLLSTEAGCADALGLCKPTSRTAGVTILSAWCERYTQCDPKRGTVDECVSSELGNRRVPTDDGCASLCSDDTDECRRSSCDEEKIEECKTASFAMKCEEQVSNGLVRYPSFCDSCFNN